MASALNHRLIANTVTVLAVGGLSTYAASRYLTPTAFADSPEPKKIFGMGPAFKYVRLQSSETINHNTKRLRFELPGGESSQSGLRLTSALLTLSWPKGNWVPVIRPYTPVSKLDEPGYIDFFIKKYPNGRSSTHLHSLNPGDSLFILATLPGFSWTANRFSHIYLIAGDKTKITVVFGVNTEADLLLRSEFNEYKKRFPDRFDIHYTVSRPGKDFSSNEGVRSGYVTKELLDEVMQGPGEKDTKIFVCGPPAMETALVGPGGKGEKGILAQLGYSKDSIHRF
ncbi:hypothetical protein ARAM_004534 [Aspergillus rambellii]|uniref:FAD-binding FR-type domain-containing protein n=1 Tax=Aspergillus rambellii TaxID=308745 RepID=A0A0F8X2D6_9EURO|nr:hypothetical protein ARAM_004534 [Aspergillus rambellii]